jgi:hypothetical protein
MNSMALKRIRKQKIDEYLDQPGETHYDFRRVPVYDLNDYIYRQFRSVRVTLITRSYIDPKALAEYNELMDQLRDSLDPIAEKMAEAIKLDMIDYLMSIEAETKRRQRGVKSIRQDEVGEWIIEKGYITDRCLTSILGDITASHLDIFEQLNEAAEEIVRNSSINVKFSSDHCKSEHWVASALNDEIYIGMETGCPCKRISQMNFD